LDEGEIDRSRKGRRINACRYGHPVGKRRGARDDNQASGLKGDGMRGQKERDILFQGHHPVLVNLDATRVLVIPGFLEHATAGTGLRFVTDLLLGEAKVHGSQTGDHQHTGQQDRLAKS
jgi:hypothetical protein